MRTKILLIALFLVSFTFSSCEKEEADTLYVKFINSSSSEFTIYSIQLLPRGSAKTETETGNNWSTNILKNGQVIAPGGHEFFTLDIPEMEWSEYRVGVIAEGNQVMLHEQAGFQNTYECPITHWGGDERTVEVIIAKDSETGIIYYSGYSDFAGID